MIKKSLFRDLTGVNKILWIVIGLVPAFFIIIGIIYFYKILMLSIFLYFIARHLYRVLKRKFKKLHILWALISLYLIILPFVILSIYTGYVGIVQSIPLYKNVSHKYGQYLSPHINNYLKSQKIDEIIKVLKVGEKAETKTTTRMDFKNYKLLYSKITKLISLKTITNFVSATGIGLLKILRVLSSFIFNLIISLVISFVFLINEDKIAKFITKFILKEDIVLIKFVKGIDNDLSDVYFGNIVVVILTSILAVGCALLFDLFFTKVEIPYAVLLGLLCGIASFIPAVGIKIIYLPLSLYVLIATGTRYNWLTGIIYSIAFLSIFALIVDLTPELILRPLCGGKEMNKILLFFSYIFGGIIFGGWGILIGPFILVIITEYFKEVYPKL